MMYFVWCITHYPEKGRTVQTFTRWNGWCERYIWMVSVLCQWHSVYTVDVLFTRSSSTSTILRIELLVGSSRYQYLRILCKLAVAAFETQSNQLRSSKCRHFFLTFSHSLRSHRVKRTNFVRVACKCVCVPSFRARLNTSYTPVSIKKVSSLLWDHKSKRA